MPTEYLVGTFKKHKQENAIVWEDDFYTYDWLLNKYNYFKDNNYVNTIKFIIQDRSIS